jgi:hypothetical protein|nr:MAG TPA: hypothetical protein [Caudoviricetes sp.]
MAKNVNIAGGGGGGVGSDELTSLLSDVVKGKTAVTSDSNDEPGTGTLELTGNAVAAHVLTGESFYTTDPKNKIVGTMTVNSILSFSVAPYSGRRVLVKWQNPYSVPGKPFGGVIVKCMTGRYPAWNASAWDAIYAGAGDNVTPGGWSQVFMDLPALNTTYYFTCFGYATTSFGEIYSPVYDPSSVKNAVYTTIGPSLVTIAGTQNYVIPDGFTSADIFCVGGGGGGGTGYRFTKEAYQQGGGGAGSGYTWTTSNIGVTAGQVLNCVVGAGGSGQAGYKGTGARGGSTSVARNGVILCNADGGYGGKGASSGSSVSGGSAGGAGGYNDLDSKPYIRAGEGGKSDGGGWSTTPGQGFTTRAFREPGNTLYAGGGGGGGVSNGGPGAGGAGGGGGGGNEMGRGNSGAPNTGGGGGGGGGASYGNEMYGGTGGSGVILIRLK